ncbi:MAG: KTSC domain-containing protein [Steroidobacteraceae bacterium]
MPSTVIRSYRYDADSQRLLIVFQTGRRYVYADVPLDVFEGLRAAHSRGAYFNAHIRDRYDFKSLEDSPPG